MVYLGSSGAAEHHFVLRNPQIPRQKQKVNQMATATAKKSTTASNSTATSGRSADELITNLQEGGQQAIGAVRRFLGKLDESLAGENSPTVIHDIADSALEMSDRMVETGGDALRGVVPQAKA